MRHADREALMKRVLASVVSGILASTLVLTAPETLGAAPVKATNWPMEAKNARQESTRVRS